MLNWINKDIFASVQADTIENSGSMQTPAFCEDFRSSCRYKRCVGMTFRNSTELNIDFSKKCVPIPMYNDL